MTLRVATVLSARPWEGDLVAHARSTAAIRLVMRAFRPGDIEARADEIDVVVAGGDVPWVTPGQVVAWRRIGLLVVGVHPVGDRPAMELFELGGADEVLADDLSADSIVQALRFLAPRDRVDTDPAGVSVAVVGARGAPGRTEVALALAWNWSAAHTVGLIDLDLEAPAVAVRLGLAARPDITDAADSVRSHGSLSRTLIQNVGKVGVVVGSHRHGEAPLRETLAEEVVEAAKARWQRVVVDLGGADPDSPLLKRADQAVLVVDSSPVGLVRGARYVAEWAGPPPKLLLNRVRPSDKRQVTAAALRWTGMEPAALVRDDPRIAVAARAGAPPHKRLRRDLARIDVNET